MKKHIPFLIALALLSISLISSCKKDPVPNNDQNNDQPTDTIPNGNDTIPVVIDGIHFGDTMGMIVTTYNTIMRFDEHWLPFILDLDGDGTDDIKIETYYDGPLAIGQFQELTLHCLNGQMQISIHGESVEKESFSHRDTTTTTYNDWTQIIYNYTYSTCGKIEENDPVSTTTVFEITANDFNDHLCLEDHFQYTNSTFLFREDIEYTLMDSPNEEEQIVTGSHTKHIYHCWNFPTDEEKYIGFKLTKNGTSRLGWLKIMLCPTWDGRVVNTKLIEIAIEK
ncbi:MAG: hypothetical protein K6A94_05540 [Bacteroidales bacterium]|nr:hypothetical protein [Bacteroidales bacterium]